ncbi:MAG: hypothetical protein HC793_03970 [Aquincola sp.]|nr:hypothetical protein [Aquincola sp.]
MPIRWTVDRLARAATRLMDALEHGSTSADDLKDAVEVLRAQRDLLEQHYLTPDRAHEASQGAYLQTQHLEWQASNNPDPNRRRELLHQASAALSAGDQLRGLSSSR